MFILLIQSEIFYLKKDIFVWLLLHSVNILLDSHNRFIFHYSFEQNVMKLDINATYFVLNEDL